MDYPDFYNYRDQSYVHLINTEATDRWALVKPQLEWTDSGNGLYYTALDVVLRDLFEMPEELQRKHFALLVESCRNYRGILTRTPDNAYGQQQWDDYMGVAVASVVLGLKEMPKDIFFTGVRNAFIMDSENNLQFKDFLGRYPHVWALMFAAAYPKLKWLAWPILAFYSKFVVRLKDDTGESAFNLQFMFQYAMSKLYNSPKYLNRWIGFDIQNKVRLHTRLKLNFEIYFGERHPFTRLVSGTILAPPSDDE